MYAPSITIDDAIDMLGDFLEPFCGGAEIIRAQVNRVPMPASPCVVLTELLTVDLATPATSYTPADDLATIVTPKRFDIQVDFYGPDAGDQCNAVKTVFRTSYTASKFNAGISPLYTSDGIQSPLITAEQQWQSRWTLTVSLQYNPAVDVPQEFADEAAVSQLVPADIFYEVQ